MFALILHYFVPRGQRAKQKPEIPTQIDTIFERNFTFDQLIDKKNVSQVTATARGAQAGQVNYAWAWFREPRV